MKKCYHPWVGLDISPQGEFKPCCKYTQSLADNLADYQASPVLAQLRSDFENGVENPGCARCWRDEQAGLPSKRTLDNEYVFKGQEPALNSIKVLSMAFGNTCNLACRICNSYSSSKWGEQAEKIKHKFPEIPIYKHNKFYKDEGFMQSIKDATHDVIHVDFAGGEPLYADYSVHCGFLIHLIEQGSKKVDLHYVTNGTRFPDHELFAIWHEFNKVDIQISVDSIGTQFNYNRWPARWASVEENIESYKHMTRIQPNIQLSISHSVSIFTVMYLPRLLDWCKSRGMPEPYLGLVSRPEYYSITVLPPEAKKVVEACLAGYPSLQPIIAAMWAKDDSSQLDTFIKHVKILDTQREQKFYLVFPELYQQLGEQCQTLYQLY
jgi:organic radical activating enzyme